MIEFSVGTVWATFTSRTYNAGNTFSTGAWITPSLTPSVTPTGTIIPTDTPTLTPTLSITETPTPTNTPSPTASLTPTVTPSVSPTATETPTPTITNTPTPTNSPTPSTTPTPSESPTPTITPTPSQTPTPSLTPTVTPPSTFGSSNSAVSFLQASSQMIDAGTGSSFNTLTTHATWEFWLKPNSFTEGYHSLLARWGNDGFQSWRLSVLNISGTFYLFAHLIDANDQNNSLTQGAYIIDNFPLNNWYHVAWAYNGTASTNSDKLKLYINGQQQTVNINGIPPTIPNSLYIPLTESVRIGADGLGEYYDGTIDNISIWNVSRSISEIQGDYLNELNGSETGLVAYWKMNEGTGTTIADSTSNSNTGSFVNSPSWVGGYPQVVLNEMMPNPSPGPDWVEIYNRSNKTVDISGWTIHDSAPLDNIIGTVPASTSLISGSFLTLDVSNRLNATGDTISLKDTSGSNVDFKVYVSGIPENVSIGRNPNGIGDWLNCATSSKGTSNNLLCI